MSASNVETLAAAVADGDSVDWQSARVLLTTAGERAVATQLQGLSSLATWNLESGRSAVDARLPFLLRLATLLACGMCLLGLGGYLLTWPSNAFPRGAPVFILGLGLFGGAALWLGIVGRDDRRARGLAGVYWTSAASFAQAGIRALAETNSLPPSVRVLLQGLRLEAFFPVFLWQFARDFPTSTRFGLMDRVCKAGLIGAGAAGVALFAANVAVRSTIGIWFPALSFLDRSYQGGRWFWITVYLTALPALACMALRGEMAEVKERSRVRLFLWSVVLALAPVAIAVLMEDLFPVYGTFMRTPKGRILGGLLVYPPMFAFPVFTAYVVLAHDVLDIRVTAQRALRYLLTRWLVAWGTSVPVMTLVAVIYVNRSEPVAQVLATPHAQLLVWTAAGGAVLLAFRGLLLRALDRWMLHGFSDPARTLAELSGDLRTARTLVELASLVARAAERALQTEADVYFIQEENVLVRATSTGRPPPRGSLVPVLVKGAGGPCVVEPRARGSYYTLLSHGDRRWIQDEGIMALCPIVRHMTGQVSAVVAFKARRSALGLSRTDLQFLSTICSAAGLALAGLEKAEAASAALPQDELGLQCAQCSRVEAWRPDADRCACGGEWERAALPSVVGNRLRLEALLGSGGMGVVYKAKDPLLDRIVAVKTLPHLSAEAAERLLQEARAMAALPHPHIAILYSAEQWRETPVLIVEYLEGGTLATRIRDKRLPVAIALDIGSTLAETLVFMHGANRCHGDIKPSNIGFTSSGVAKFLDFGLSRSLQGGADRNPQVGGTLPYLSPEVLNGESPGPSSDVWALSIVLFESLALYHPFLHETETVARIRAGFRDSVRLRAALSAPLADLLCGLLSPSPAERPPTASALLERLHGVRFIADARS